MPIKKLAVKKLSTKSARKPGKAVKKSAPVKASKKATKKRTSAQKRTPLPAKFTPGSDLDVAFQELKKGGADRLEIFHRLKDLWQDHLTQAGKEKPVSTIINQVLGRCLANGYRIESHYRLVEVDGNEEEAAEEMEEKPAKKKAIKKAAKLARKK